MTHSHTTPECRELLADLSAYLDGELEQNICDQIEAHLSQCDDCRLMLDTTRKTLVLYRQTGQVDIPAGALDRLWAALDAEGCSSPAADA
jgi:anti-sigma factor RsiW